MENMDTTGECSQSNAGMGVDTQSTYQCNMETRLAELGAKIDEQAAKAQCAATEEIEELKLKRQAAGRKLEELKTTSKEAWTEVREGVDRSLQELSQAWEELCVSSKAAAAKFTDK